MSATSDPRSCSPSTKRVLFADPLVPEDPSAGEPRPDASEEDERDCSNDSQDARREDDGQEGSEENFDPLEAVRETWITDAAGRSSMHAVEGRFRRCIRAFTQFIEDDPSASGSVSDMSLRQKTLRWKWQTARAKVKQAERAEAALRARHPSVISLPPLSQTLLAHLEQFTMGEQSLSQTISGLDDTVKWTELLEAVIGISRKRIALEDYAKAMVDSKSKEICEIHAILLKRQGASEDSQQLVDDDTLRRADRLWVTAEDLVRWRSRNYHEDISDALTVAKHWCQAISSPLQLLGDVDEDIALALADLCQHSKEDLSTSTAEADISERISGRLSSLERPAETKADEGVTDEHSALLERGVRILERLRDETTQKTKTGCAAITYALDRQLAARALENLPAIGGGEGSQDLPADQSEEASGRREQSTVSSGRLWYETFGRK